MGALPATALPLVLRKVYDDAIEVGRDRRIAAKVRQRAVESKKRLLRKVFDMRATAGHARKRAEDEPLVFADKSFKVLRR